MIWSSNPKERSQNISPWFSSPRLRSENFLAKHILFFRTGGNELTENQKITPTPEQEAIVSATEKTSQSLMIQAYAGCAKTTTLELASKKIKVPALALAFNVSIKQELAKRFPANFSVQTMNGLGFASLMRALPAVSFDKPDNKKLGKIITEVVKDSKIELAEYQFDLLRELTRKAMNEGIVPRDEGAKPLLPDTEESWIFLCDEIGMSEDDRNLLIPLAWQSLEASNQAVLQGKISFDDQVYYSACIKAKFPQFPVLMVDEAQDLSPLNHSMLLQAMRPDGRLIACGDAKQAIYAFRGADSDSIGKIEKLRRDWINLPLATTFRCPKLVVARQQSHAPGFKAWEECKEGIYEKLGAQSFEDEEGWTLRDLFAKLPSEDASIAFLCRNNAPLLGMAFKLIRQRIGVSMLGRDIGQGLIILSRKLFPDNSTGLAEMEGKLQEWEDEEIFAAGDNDDKIESARDKAESLRAVMGFTGINSAKDLREALHALFSREDGRIQLGSIHRSKGLEWDVMVHLDPWRIPSKQAKEAAKRGDERALQQEMNLKYVCETRTKNVLIEANYKEFL